MQLTNLKIHSNAKELPMLLVDILRNLPTFTNVSVDGMIIKKEDTDVIFLNEVMNVNAGQLQSLVLEPIKIQAEEMCLVKFNNLMRFLLQSCTNLKDVQ